MEHLSQLTFDNGTLIATANGVPYVFDRPASLARTRLNILPLTTEPNSQLSTFNSPSDLLAFVYQTLPFAKSPLPPLALSDSFTPAARAAFNLLICGDPCKSADMPSSCPSVIKVLRGEIDDYVLFAVCDDAVWHAGCLTKNATTLTVRFEDLWSLLPQDLRAYNYTAEIIRDPVKQDGQREAVHESVTNLAPDVRIFIEAKPSGGFVISFHPGK